jgi:hypothetical protein
MVYGDKKIICKIFLTKNGLITESRAGPVFSTSLTTNSSGELDILWHNCDSLGMNCTEIGILK